MSEQPADGQPTRRQFVKFTFFQIDPSWRGVAGDERADGARALCQAVEELGDRMLIGSYSLVGLRGDADFLLWQIADDLESFQALAARLLATALGPHLRVTHSYLSMTRRSIYRTPKGGQQVDGRLRLRPGDAQYLFVYPFVKTRAWYELAKDVRQEMMSEHITMGRRYPSVKLNTSYSYGLDDQEFVVSFETENPADFLDLVMELRETKASAYTLRDTPAFTCVAMELPQILESLGAPAAAARAEAGATEAPAADDGWTPVAQLADVPEGAATVVYCGGEQVALFNIAGRVYAIDNRCSHANGPLAEGAIDGTSVTCPWHDSQFDVRTGQPLRAPAQRPLRTYQVRIDGETVLLAAEEPATAAPQP